MMEPLTERLQEAILKQNEDFLRIKEINRNFHENVLKIPAQNQMKKKHIENSKSLLAKIQRLIDTKEKRVGEVYEGDYYDFPETLEPSDLIRPPSALDGYIADATRKYFTHLLHIGPNTSHFENHEDQYFDFRLDDLLEEKSLRDSLEIKHTVEWALIGKALAAIEIEKLTKKRGPRKTRSNPESASLIDRKRLDFIEGVVSQYIQIEMDLQIEDLTLISDYEIVSTYKAMLVNSRAKDEDFMKELESHIRLGSMSIDGACNSISKARNCE